MRKKISSLKQKYKTTKTKKHIHAKLLEKCRQGNSQAQFKIYKLYYKAMYNTSLRILGNPAEAEDIMQEAFLSAFGKLNTWSQDTEFGAWLKKIVINKSLDILKKRKMIFSEAGKDYSDTEQNIPDKQESKEKSIKIIKETIKELPEKYRIIIVLFLFEGYEQSEIGEILGIKHGTVRVRYKRAKEKLVLLLKNKGMKNASF